MIKYTVIAIGQKMPDWVNIGIQEYAKRLGHEVKFEIIELPMAKRTKSSVIEQCKNKEGQHILQTIPEQSYVVVMDENGTSYQSHAFAKKLETLHLIHHHIVFIIGGPDGLSKEVKERSDESWSLSSLTLPHPLVRIHLTEALYRAWSMNHAHPYHRS